MICIDLKNTNPFFCLAAEEYLLQNFDDDVFMLWQTENAVVVGKHQNAMGEINYRFVRENNITVARRISGGGTVFHDTGNVNFSFIKNVKSPAEISFREFIKPVVETLAKLGLTATTSGRNDILIDGKKISGNAEHIYKNRVLHHGTLLFNSDLKNLGNAIKTEPGKYSSKAVQSNRSEVANILPFLKNNLTVTDFIRFMIGIQLEKKENTIYKLTETDNKNIEELAKSKFISREWNFGLSPKYSFSNSVVINGKTILVKLNVKRGKIKDASVSGNYFSVEKAKIISAQLTGRWHIFEDVNDVLAANTGNPAVDLIYCFF